MMDELRAGIRFHHFFLEDSVKTRITLSQGNCDGAPFSTAEAKYVKSARIPRRPWRAASDSELAQILGDKPVTDHRASVALIALPTSVVRPLEALHLETARTREEFFDLIQSEKGSKAVEGVVDWMKPLLVSDEAFRIIRVFNPPALLTTAYLPESDQYVGLHVDNMYRQPVTGRSRTPNRLSLNLTSEDRYLLYVNLTIDEIIGTLTLPKTAIPMNWFRISCVNFPIIR